MTDRPSAYVDTHQTFAATGANSTVMPRLNVDNMPPRDRRNVRSTSVALNLGMLLKPSTLL